MNARVRELLASLSKGVPGTCSLPSFYRATRASGWTGANPHGGSHCPDNVRAHGLFPHDGPHVDGYRVTLALRACEAEVGQRLYAS
jgi:hypothetical protein